MPLYEFECRDCGPFTELRGLDASSRPANCPKCGESAPRIFSAINLRSMRSENRLAHQRNERSANAPHSCGAGCSHSHARPKSPPAQPSGKPALQSSTKRNRRPWMLGH